MNIALIGMGKMGKAVEQIALQKGHSIVLRIDAENLADLTTENLQKADVAIEFTRPDAVISNLMKCLASGTPVVSGTTGWHQEFETIRNRFISENGAMITATNFSIGVNIFFQLNKELAGWMKEHQSYIPHLTEWHHTRKLDQPSGTAVTLADDLVHKHTGFRSWQLAEGNEKVAEDVIGITAVREGDIIGIHELTWTSPIDKITIRHEAYNRDGFASGALLAAEWLIGKKGVFSMSDVLFGKPNR